MWLPLLATFALSVLVTALVFVFRESLSRLGDWGYFGAFVTQLLNSLTVLFPSLGHLVIMILAQDLNPWLLGLIGGVGAGLGELSGYLVGLSGRRMVDRGTPWLARLLGWSRQRGAVVIFLFAVLPLPFDVVGIWAGSARYHLGRFLVYTTGGKIIKVTAIAWAGRQGITWLEHIL